MKNVEAQEKDVATEAKAQPGRDAHPLMLKNVVPYLYWQDWLNHWKSAEGFRQLESLLHYGFNVSFESEWINNRYVPVNTEEDRLLFYLSVADGWTACPSDFQLPNEGDTKHEVGFDDKGHSIKMSPSEIRQQLARKAFDVLCSNYFKKSDLRGGGRDGDKFNDSWLMLANSDRLFAAIQKFFRIEFRWDGLAVLHNFRYWNDVRRSYSERQVVTFFINLATFLWEWREDTPFGKPDPEVVERDAKTRAAIEAAKPWMIEVLASIRNLDVLYKHIFELNEKCLAKLKEIALRTELKQYSHPIAETRKVATVEEACYAGSEVAALIKMRELSKAEHDRLIAIRESEKAVQAEQDRLADIKQAEDEAAKAARKLEELKRGGSKKS